MVEILSFLHSVHESHDLTIHYWEFFLITLYFEITVLGEMWFGQNVVWMKCGLIEMFFYQMLLGQMLLGEM